MSVFSVIQSPIQDGEFVLAPLNESDCYTMAKMISNAFPNHNVQVLDVYGAPSFLAISEPIVMPWFKGTMIQ